MNSIPINKIPEDLKRALAKELASNWDVGSDGGLRAWAWLVLQPNSVREGRHCYKPGDIFSRIEGENWTYGDSSTNVIVVSAELNGERIRISDALALVREEIRLVREQEKADEWVKQCEANWNGD